MKAEKNRCVSPLIISLIIMGILVLGSVMIVVADEAPHADADPDHQTVDVGEDAHFSGSASIDRDGYIVSYSWVFGDGLVYHGENINYTYNTPGDYTVELTVEDNGGNTDTDYVTVTVQDGTPSENLTVWIDSLTTDKAGYEENETVAAQVIVERGNDLLTFVWEGTLVLEVFDDAKALAYTDEAAVNLPSGGTKETHNFEFVLTESGDYLVIAILYDSEDNQVDIMEISITVREGSGGGNGTMMVWIESLTTDKDEYDVNETVNTQVIVKRGNDPLDYVWEGILTLEVFDDGMFLIFSEDQEVSIPCGGWTQPLNFEYILSEPGHYLVRATLYDVHDEFMDSKEISITVGDDNSGGNGTRLVWIESLTTDKDEYDVNEIVNTQVTVKRGDDLLTYVWEGALILEVFDNGMVLVFIDERSVYLPSGGMTETHNFEYMLTEPGDYLVRATLYDLHDELMDIKEVCITVGDDNSGGNGTDPRNDGDRNDPPDSGDRDDPPDDGDRDDYPDDRNGPSDREDGTAPSTSDEREPSNNNMGFFTGDKGGIFQTEGGWQIALGVIFAIAVLVISSFATLRYLKRFGNKKKKP
jgi:PKD repeat protein